jgi:WD40 repeat protein
MPLDGREIAVLKGHTRRVKSAAFSPDGQRVVTASDDSTARVWDAADGREIAVLKGHTGWVLSAAFSHDGKRVVTVSSDSTTRAWDAVDGREIAVLKGHTGPVGSAAFSPDGQRVVTASDDSTARVWDAADGREIAVVRGHTGLVQSAAFSPDGKRVVTASNDSTARVWDAADGREIAVLRGHTGRVQSAAFSPDGKRVVTASDDNTARVWRMQWASVAELTDAGIARVPRCLFPQERLDLFIVDSEMPAWCYASAKPPYQPLRYGIAPINIDARRAKRLRLAMAQGVLIDRVHKGLSAHAGGLKVNDVVLTVNGTPVVDRKSFSDALDRVPAGGSARLGVLRAGERLEIVLTPAY